MSLTGEGVRCRAPPRVKIRPRGQSFSSVSGPRNLRRTNVSLLAARLTAQRKRRKPHVKHKFASNRRNNVLPLICRSLGHRFFSEFCAVFCALASAQQTAQDHRVSNFWAWKQRGKGVREPGLREACGSDTFFRNFVWRGRPFAGQITWCLFSHITQCLNDAT